MGENLENSRRTLVPLIADTYNNTVKIVELMRAVLNLSWFLFREVKNHTDPFFLLSPSKNSFSYIILTF